MKGKELRIKTGRNQQTEEPSTERLLVLSLGSGKEFKEPNSRTRFGVLLGILLLSICTLGLVAFLVDYHTSSAARPARISAKIDPPLATAMQLTDEDELFRVIIYMQDTAHDNLADLPEAGIERRTAVAETLQKGTSESQQAIVRELQRHEADGQVSSYRSLWIINALQVSATAPAIATLAGRGDVARVGPDSKIQLLSPVTSTESSLAEIPAGLPWSLERTRVSHVWAGLDITGTGVTVAIMDTGVDWLHPALKGSYRGATDVASPTPDSSWFDAIDGAPEPFDPNGHGTHVAGTASGRNGIGVAPGSKWMAVRVLDERGYGYLGDIHAGFQWLLAPGGDPSSGPNVVNGSWSADPELEDFFPDVDALHAAGIITVFSAGNSGPATGSIRSPANYPGVVAVGASDDIDQVAWFSSRGPSNWTSQVKPTVVAPGMQIFSSLPGGQYGHKNGTSMSAPHVAGLYALLLSADDQLSPAQATRVLTATATRPARVLPNDDYGWGQVDAYASLSSIVVAGRLHGVVQGAAPLPGTAITITTPADIELGFTFDSDGSFVAELISGTYRVEIAAFGYETYVNQDVTINYGSETELSVILMRLPHGKITGQLLDLETGLPLSGEIRVDKGPQAIPVGADGRYEAELPAGQYELVAWVGGHRLGRFSVTLSADEDLVHDFLLPSAPRILLIDSGQWYGNSQEEIYATALRDNDFSFSTLSVRNPFLDRPTVELLSQYEVIIWSAPEDSPGTIDAGGALTEYLADGGNVLVAGQNTAVIDQNWAHFQQWWHTQLRGLYLGKAEAPFELAGEVGSVFEDLQLVLEDTSEDGAEMAPDASLPRPGALTQIGLRYADGTAAVLLADQCNPFHLAHFGFGLQNVRDSVKRADLIARTLDYFDQPESTVGVHFDRPIIEDFVPPGGRRSYPIQVVNLSETLTDTIRLEFAEPAWSAKIITDTMELGPCQSGSTALEIDIPEDAPPDSLEILRLVASSLNFPEYERTLEIRLETPGSILMVDDDRWYDQAPEFKEAMSAADLDFDFWEIESRAIAPASPPLDLLSAYDFVVWYTGYDWFRPITAEESEALSAYAEQGGRLFLTSQDYLYYHQSDAFTRDYLGVVDYAETVTPTVAYGGAYDSPFAELVGPLSLEYDPYNNYSDGLVPAPGTLVSLWHDQGYAAGVANSGSDWRTVFWGLPFETLPVVSQAKSMNRILGWLSDLGESSFQVDRRSGLVSDLRTFTLTLRYSSAGPGSMVAVTNSLPFSLNVDLATISEGIDYDPDRHQLTWRGHLDPGQQHQITYKAVARQGLSPGARIENSVQIHYDDHDLLLERAVPFWLEAPDPTASRMLVTPGIAAPGQLVTYELELFNQGHTAGLLDARVKLPESLTPITDTAHAPRGEVMLTDSQLDWQGWLQPGEAVTVTVVMKAPFAVRPAWLPATAIVEDGVTDPVILDTLLEARPHTSHLPVVARGKP
ncbi:MAG: S8 family serine peptidase [Chloroflexota bacterium]|nr:MAG: S8 family serine peptidase [Chloroflexota bacterium]